MESLLASLKEQVKCSLCTETFNQPKLLSCFHVFCTACIKGHSKHQEDEKKIFECPKCNSQTSLQDLNDVEDLQTSPVHSRILKVLEFVENQKICSVSSSHPEALWQCIECDTSLCEECLRCHSAFLTGHQVFSLSDLKEEDIRAMLKKERPCAVHDRYYVESHCQDCDMLICWLCLKENHHKHNITSLQESITIEKDLLSEILEDIDKTSNIEDEKKNQEEMAQRIKREGEKAEKEIKELTRKLIKTLKNNEQQYLSRIHKSITKAERNLRVLQHTAQAQEYIKYFMENATASEMIDARKDESNQNFTFDSLDQTVPTIKFEPNDDFGEEVECYLGDLTRYLKKADPRMSSVTAVEPSEIQAMKKALLTINLKTSKKEDTDEYHENIAVTFTPYDCVDEVEMIVDDSEVIVEFTPCVAGQLSADVVLHGSPVLNSPLVLSVKPQQMEKSTDYAKLKEALNVDSKGCRCIAVNNTNSKIAVIASELHCVNVFNMEGDLLLTYGSYGTGQGQLNDPNGLAFVNNTELVVADSGNHRLCIVNTDTGTLLRTFGCHGDGNGQFSGPHAVYVDKQSNIFVCDCGNNRVQMFNKCGVYESQFSIPSPTSVVKHNEVLYVVDGENFVVHVIKEKDQLFTTVATIGGRNSEDLMDTEGVVEYPWGLAIDSANNLLVIDATYCLIYKFTLHGRYVGQSVGLEGEPNCIAALDGGHIIYLTDGGVGFLK